MDYFQGVVTEFLRATRSIFVNTEYLLQLDAGDVYIKGRHWYCDAVAINHADSTIQLCEITYSKTLHSLTQRLRAWNNNWPAVVQAIYRDSSLTGVWRVEPRIFIPSQSRSLMERKLAQITPPPDLNPAMPAAIVTTFEDVLPWMYRSWNGKPFANEADG